MMRTLLQALLFMLATAAGAACGSQPASQPAAAATESAAAATVAIDNFSFTPAQLTVAAGTTVTWVNHDDVPHTVTSSTKPRLFDSKALDTDEKFSFTFRTTGTYSYFCTVHPHMTGTIIVK